MRFLKSLITGQTDQPEENPVASPTDPWHIDNATTDSIPRIDDSHGYGVIAAEVAPDAPQHASPEDTGTDLQRAAMANAEGDADADEDDGAPCPTCGRMIPPARHFLADTLAQVSTRAPVVIATFYGRLFDRREDIGELFERMGIDTAQLTDPNSDPRQGPAGQRDKLLAAATAVASHYNPGSKKSMQALDSALDKMGATHGESRMTLPDKLWPGGWRPLLAIDYHDIIVVLVDTLAEFQGPTWTTQHHAAWMTALTYVSDRMGAAQILAAPRHAK